MSLNSSLPDDLLASAQAALRRAPPEGPSQEALDRALAAVRAAESAPRVAPFFHRPSALRLAKVAAVFVVAATALFGASEWARFPPQVAFAEVAQKLRDAHTLVYRLRVESPQMKGTPIQAVKVFAKGRGHERMESEHGQVNITDRVQGKFLLLDPKANTAVVTEVKLSKFHAEAREPDENDLVGHLRNLVKAEGERAGEKEIGGRKAQGFRAKEGRLDWLIWADAQTKEPLLAEVSFPHEVKLTLSDFELNRPLDDGLFSLDAPEGYKVESRKLDLPTPEEALTRYLRSYAETADSEFPPRLDDFAAIGKHFHEARKKNAKPGESDDEPSPEAMQFASDAAMVGGFFLPLKQGYTYRPQGAKLGDGKRMIFWYRPSEAENYRALDADLNWSDVAADQLPQQPN